MLIGLGGIRAGAGECALAAIGGLSASLAPEASWVEGGGSVLQALPGGGKDLATAQSLLKSQISFSLPLELRPTGPGHCPSPGLAIRLCPGGLDLAIAVAWRVSPSYTLSQPPPPPGFSVLLSAQVIGRLVSLSLILSLAAWISQMKDTMVSWGEGGNVSQEALYALCLMQAAVFAGSWVLWHLRGAALFCLQQVGFLPGSPPVSGGPPFPLVLLSPREGFALVGASVFDFPCLSFLSFTCFVFLFGFFSLFWFLSL